MLKIKYIGHSAFQFKDGQNDIIIDPFITGNPVAKTKVEEIKSKYIILTHGHSDHFGDTLSLVKQNDAEVIAINELANNLSARGIKAYNMNIGGAYHFPFGKVKFTIAHHSSADDQGMYLGNPAGVIVNIAGKNIYHCGDTGLFYDMKLIGEMQKIDVMIVPIGDYFTMGIDDAVKAVQFVNPKLAIPSHYNTYPIITQDGNEFKDKVNAIGIDCKIMNIDEEIQLM